MEKSEFRDCKINDSSFSSVSHKGLKIHSSDLSGTAFRGTTLSSLSLTSSSLGGIYISEDARELKGARLDVAQTMDAARLLGIEIIG